MATKVFDNFLEDKYLDELNDYNIWQLVAKQDMKWVDIHSKPTNIFERIIKKEYHKISPLYNTFKGYERNSRIFAVKLGHRMVIHKFLQGS